jgi:Flp pilus assembly protein TadG
MLIKIKIQYKISEFKSDRRGGFAVVFALSAFPLILVAGIAVDYSRATSARTSLQKAVDSAALTGAALKTRLEQLSGTFWHFRCASH